MTRDDGKSDGWKLVGNGKSTILRLFAGREYDPETGLYHNRARTYSPELGRFLQRDPIGTADQVNLYTYVANNPLKWTDPMGKEKSLIVLTIDKWGVVPTFDEDWYAKNWETSYVASQYNSLISGNPWKKFEIRLVYDFGSFDNVINEKQRDEIYFIWHWFVDSITLNNWSIWTDASSNPSLVINSQVLANDTQTNQQAQMLSNTTLYLLSCETGNVWLLGSGNPIGKQIEEHYGFSATYAPTEYIHPGWAIYNDDYGVQINGEWSIFTNQ